MKKVVVLFLLILSVGLYADSWESKKVLDCFGDETKQNYITNGYSIVGSSSYNIPVEVDVQIFEGDEVLFRLYLFNNLVGLDYVIPLDYSVKIKDSNGIVYSYKGYGKADGVHVYDIDLCKHLSTGDCKVYLESNERFYLFKLKSL